MKNTQSTNVYIVALLDESNIPLAFDMCEEGICCYTDKLQAFIELSDFFKDVIDAVNAGHLTSIDSNWSVKEALLDENSQVILYGLPVGEGIRINPIDSQIKPIVEDASNDNRAIWAEHAVEAFAVRTGISDEDMDLKVSDLIADIMHLCDRHDLDFQSMFQRAEMHYEAELEDDANDYEDDFPDEDNCECGEPLDMEGWNGMCGDCADRKEAADESIIPENTCLYMVVGRPDSGDEAMKIVESTSYSQAIEIFIAAVNEDYPDREIHILFCMDLEDAIREREGATPAFAECISRQDELVVFAMNDGKNPRGLVLKAEQAGDPGVFQEISVSVFKDKDCLSHTVIGVDESDEVRILSTVEGNGDGDHNLVVFPCRTTGQIVETFS